MSTSPVIRPAQPEELAAVVGALGNAEFFTDRLARQRQAKGTLLIAWQDGQPVGGVYVWRQPAEEPEVREHLPGVPLLNRVQVVAAHRNEGIGSLLVSAAEQLLTEHGHDRVALAVEQTNVDAARLYKRLGYQDWGFGNVICYSEATDEHGRAIPERCWILLKDLAGQREPS